LSYRRSLTLALAEPISTYTARVIQTNYLDFTRVILLELESGGRVDFRFTDMAPVDWLRRYVVPVKAQVRKAEGLDEGDAVTVRLTVGSRPD